MDLYLVLLIVKILIHLVILGFCIKILIELISDIRKDK
jgi:hypothetical protein